MQHAKKMYLVDQRSVDKLKDENWKKPVEHMLDALKSREDNSWQKPIEKRTKTKLSLEMKRILESEEDDDLKAKQYRRVLNRFLNIKRRTKEVAIDATVEEAKPEVKTKPIKQPKRQPSPEPTRKSARDKKQKFKWVEY
jgi:hypothetical protein